MKPINLRLKIEKAIFAIDKEISEKKLPAEGPMSLAQLSQFKQALYQMRDVLNRNNTPREQREIVSLGKIIVDSWPLNSELGKIIIQAEEEFRKFEHLR